jgi:hypothetical protein
MMRATRARASAAPSPAAPAPRVRTTACGACGTEVAVGSALAKHCLSAKHFPAAPSSTHNFVLSEELDSRDDAFARMTAIAGSTGTRLKGVSGGGTGARKTVTERWVCARALVEVGRAAVRAEADAAAPPRAAPAVAVASDLKKLTGEGKGHGHGKSARASDCLAHASISTDSATGKAKLVFFGVHDGGCCDAKGSLVPAAPLRDDATSAGLRALLADKGFATLADARAHFPDVDEVSRRGAGGTGTGTGTGISAALFVRCAGSSAPNAAYPPPPPSIP